MASLTLARSRRIEAKLGAVVPEASTSRGAAGQSCRWTESAAELAAGGGEGPGLVRREGDDGREDPHQRLEDAVDRGLRGAAQGVVGSRGVEPVLQDVVVGRRQRHRAELVAELVDAVELVGVVGGRRRRGPARRPGGAPSGRGGPCAPRARASRAASKVEQVRQLEAERVADQPVGLARRGRGSPSRSGCRRGNPARRSRGG